MMLNESRLKALEVDCKKDKPHELAWTTIFK
jgi:hypothetical protein